MRAYGLSGDARESGVSPVVGVILMVAVTVILSAVIGAFVFNLGQSTTEGSQDSLGVRTSHVDGEVTVQVVTGEADELKILRNGNEVDALANPSAGDELSIAASESDSVSVVSVTDGDSKVVSTDATQPGGNPTVPQDGLIAHWAMDDSATPDTAIDETGTYDGDITNATYISGVSGSALEFYDPTNAKVDVVGIGDEFNSNNAFTIVGWFKTEELTNYRVAYGKKNYADGSQANFWLEPYRTDTLGVSGSFRNASGNQQKFESGHIVTKGEWTHIAWTWDGQYATLYVNGEQVHREDTGGMQVNVPSDHRIGLYNSGSNEYPGDIDELRVYKRALSDDDVQDAYIATKP